MTIYRIPDLFMPGFEILAKLPDSDIQKVTRCLEKMEAGSGPQKFQAELKHHIEDQKTVEYLTKTIFSLGSLLSEKKIDNKSLSKELADIYVQQSKLEHKNKDKLRNNLVDNLNKIFEKSEYLLNTQKLIELISENDKVFRDCRIFTDIRMLFDEDAKLKDPKSVLIHRFKITYLEDDEYRSVYLALDSDDLVTLKEQINRAEKKETEIKTSLANIRVIPVTE